MDQEVAQTVQSNGDELARRHRVAALTVVGMMALTLVLIALALGGVFIARTRSQDPFLEGALRITIVLFGLGAVALKRTRFAAARLQDIASLRGSTALLKTLQNTTVMVALLGGSIAIMGFIIAAQTGNGPDMVWLGLVALAVLLYCYPRRAAWQRVVDATQTPGGVTNAPSAKGTIA